MAPTTTPRRTVAGSAFSTGGDPSQPAGKRRDSRTGVRKVTSLTAEQLERKRANDREAQRTSRARTKEHIESLEHQVAELSAKGQEVDRVLKRNTMLESEIAHLRQQLAMMTNRQLYQSEDERRSSTSSNPTSVISSPFNGPPSTDTIPPPIPPLTRRTALSQRSWYSYVSPPETGTSPSTSISVNGPEQSHESPYSMTADSLAGSSTGHTQHDMGYGLPHTTPAQYANDNADSYNRNLIYPSRTAMVQPRQQQHQPQQSAVATMGYEQQNIPSLQATHLPIPAHHTYPSQNVHCPHSQIEYQSDSRV